MPTPAQQLSGFLAKFDAKIAAVARAALSHLRGRLPGAYELVYDNYNALAIAFSPSATSSQAIFSIAVYPRWVSLFFGQGARLEDPKKLLKGSGNKMRHIVLAGVADIKSPDIEALIRQALKGASPPIDASRRRTLLIKAVAKKQRPRRVGRPVVR